MSEDRDFEDLVEEVEDLQKQLSKQKLYIGVLSIISLLLVVDVLMTNPAGFYFLAIIAIIIIPCAAILNTFEERGL